MEGLLQPSDLFFILLIVLIIFGLGRLPNIGEGLHHLLTSKLRDEQKKFRSALFMAQGVDPEVGRDVGDMLPDEDSARSTLWWGCLIAILVGNTMYFASTPLLPAAARFDALPNSGLPAAIDLWSCLMVFGLLNLVISARTKNKPK